MREKPFADLLADARTSAVKLELRDEYMPDDPAYVGWRAGEPLDATVARYQEWTDLAQATVRRGVTMRRVRIVTVPVSDYIRFEHAVTGRVSLSVGEEIRWLPRQDAAGLTLPGDYWLIDDEIVMWLRFSEDGDLLDTETTAVAEDAESCRDVFAAAWKRSIPHEEFHP